jgi:hypothetical protein
MNVAAIFLDIRLQLFQIVIEMIQGVLFDFTGQGAEFVGIGKFQKAKFPGVVVAEEGSVQSGLQPFIARCLDADAMEIELGFLGLFEEILCVGIERLALKRGCHRRIVTNGPPPESEGGCRQIVGRLRAGISQEILGRMHIYRCRLVLVCSVIFLAIVARSAQAQTGVDLLVKTWGEGAAVETTSDGMLEAASHSKDDDERIRLSEYHLTGRWRIFPDQDATPRLGYDIQYFDLGTHDPALPRHLFNGTVGFAQPIAVYQKWIVALTGSVGYAGESPLSDPRAVYEQGNIILIRQFSEERKLAVGLNYDGNRVFLPDVPIAGFAYADRYNDFFNYVIGLPYSSITWEPTKGFQIEAGYALLRTFDAKIAYQFSKHWAAYGEYNDQLTPFHIDNTSPDRRLFLQTHDVEAGIRWNLSPLIRFSVGGGWAFGQEFWTGFDLRGTNPLRHIADAPFGKVRIEIGF